MKTGVKGFLAVATLLAGCANGLVDVEDPQPAPGDTVLPGEGDAGAVEASDWKAGSAGAPSNDAGEEAAVDASNTPLECDSRFNLTPKAPSASASFNAKFTDTPGYPWVDLELAGSGTPVASWQGVNGSSPFTWVYKVTGHQPGVLTLTFVKDKEPGTNGTKVASCKIEIVP
ncbi:MAG: hypothetical protein KC776_42625 [Myxococcales bacterium]|nr:hypothetical protein [Myxococcales bacterium]MCB9576305.1 hypothetical protein [Polyangiaceae bacterium]